MLQKRSQKREPKGGAEKRSQKKEPKKIAERKQVQKTIKDLQEDGLLLREGSNRRGKWIVKK